MLDGRNAPLGVLGVLAAVVIFLAAGVVVSFTGVGTWLQGEDPGVISTAWQFRLRQPGEGWQLLEAEDAEVFARGAVAGATGPRATVGVVRVEPHVGGEPEDLLRSVIAGSELEAPQIESIGPRELAGNPGAEAVVVGRYRGEDWRYVIRLGLHGGYAYTLSAWGRTESVPAEALAPFFDSFELLDGEVLGELVAEVEVARGVGWQVRDGVLESAAYGLRAEAGGRWRLVVGADLQRFSPEAEVGFETPEAVLYVVPDRVADPLGWQTRKLAGFVEQFEDVEKLPLRILGEDIDTLVATIGPHQQRFGTLCREGLCLQIAMAYPVEAAETVADDLHDPPILEWMAPGRVSALRREMLEDPVWEAAMGRDYVLRRGDFVHFAAGVRWTAPPGLWRLRTGDAAAALGSGVLLGFEEPILGVRGQISVREPPEPTGDAAVETARGLEVRSTADTVVAVRRDDAVVLDVITGAPELKELAKRGLAVEPAGLLDAGSFNGVFRDLRLGFSTRHEALGFALEDRTPPTASDRARILRFSREREVVYVVGLYEDDAEGDLLARRMQRLIQVTLGREVDGEAERSDGVLADQPAVSLTWPATGREVIGAITTRDRFAYAVVAIGYGFGATADFRGAVAGFALL